mmetsp:Transcript_9663/g.27544  ORF Transcript_9663/g.27544 Transcript_9663/m.27544 type:complete len:259 (+) Transcript_9663:422-1198(+)
MFFLFDGSIKDSAPQALTISASKACTFQSNGEGQEGLSYEVRAETIFTCSMIGKRAGMNFKQLSSIQPRSAFVNNTTVPCCFARRKVSMAAAATSPNNSFCISLTTEDESRRKPCRWIHVEGKIVSSQSKMKRVSCGVKGSVSARWNGTQGASASAASPAQTAGAAGEASPSPSLSLSLSSSGKRPGLSCATASSSPPFDSPSVSFSPRGASSSDSKSTSRINSLHSETVVVGVVSSPESSWSSLRFLPASATTAAMS